MEITDKMIYLKLFKIFSQIFLIIVGMNIGINIFPNHETEMKTLIALLGFISFRIFLSFLICIKLFFNIGLNFENDMEYKLWKYTQRLFIIHKFIIAIETLYAFSTFMYLYTKINNIANIIFTMLVILNSIFYFFSMINLIIFEPNNFDIIINIDYFKNNQILKPKKEIKRNIPFVDEECSICLQNELGTEWAELPCKHKFHYECINCWINIGNICPICRQ